MSKVAFTCAECGGDGEAWPSDRRQFCSLRCKQKAMARRANAKRKLTARYPVDAEGYLRDPENARRRLHRRIAEDQLGRPLRPGEVVHHINGDKLDNRPENLHVFASQAEHMRHHTRDLPRGGQHHAAKLTDEQMVDIARRVRGGEEGKALAVEFGVSPATISRIKHTYKQEVAA